MAQTHISLKPTEQAIVTAAATIFAGYLTAGRVTEGDEDKWLKQSITDAAIIADGELN